MNHWSDWNPVAAESPWTLGVEEEVMLLDPASWQLAWCTDEVLDSFDLDGQASPETHGCALEIATRPQPNVAEAINEIATLRARLARGLEPHGLVAAVAGTHPLAVWEDVEISPGARYQFLYSSMREIARREPTFGLHVHVAVPDPEAAVRALNGLRAHLPVILALSANSPFWQGRETGLASIRVPLFGMFPRTGIPRHFDDYRDYVAAIDRLLVTGAFPEPTFLWWDVRLQPKLGTLEVRIMDAQTRISDTAALTALVQCLVRLEAMEGWADATVEAPEVVAENHFLAARDGVRAQLLFPRKHGTRPMREWVGEMLAACAPHAADLGCAAELATVATLLEAPGEARQRALASALPGEGDPEQLRELVRALHLDFASSRAEPAALHA